VTIEGRPVTIEVSGALGPAAAEAAVRLAERAARQDGVGPLSEHALLHLRHGGEPAARDLLVWHDGVLQGYAHLDPPNAEAGPSGEMVIDPAFRRQGLGLRLARALIAEAGDRDLRLWAHGELPAAAGLAAAAGFERTRSLWQMRRPLRDPLPAPKLADGINVRAFRVGQDEDAWIALNALAFAHHPEQGSWTRPDLDVREQEPWFDPAGFFLAERDGRLAGFHWTKVHGGKEPVGEVYVVGVDPAERGTGLGRALTLIGLRHLRDSGLPAVILYVDEDNTAAVRLYESLGFDRVSTDVMFTHWPG
jgi:mycothiol synthase